MDDIQRCLKSGVDLCVSIDIPPVLAMISEQNYQHCATSVTFADVDRPARYAFPTMAFMGMQVISHPYVPSDIIVFVDVKGRFTILPIHNK